MHQRYGKKFIAQNCDYIYRRIPGPKVIRTLVVSTDHPPVEFYVTRLVSSSRSNYKSYGESIENVGYKTYIGYLEQLWGKELNTKIQIMADNIFSQPVFTRSGVNIPGSFLSQLQNHTPSYFETRKNHPEVFSNKYFSQSFSVITFSDISDAGKQTEAERIFRFINELRNEKTDKFVLHVFGYLPSHLPYIQKQIEKLGGKENFIHIESGTTTMPGYTPGKFLHYRLIISWNEIEMIRNSGDVIPYIRMVPR